MIFFSSIILATKLQKLEFFQAKFYPMKSIFIVDLLYFEKSNNLIKTPLSYRNLNILLTKVLSEFSKTDRIKDDFLYLLLPFYLNILIVKGHVVNFNIYALKAF